MAAPMKRFLTRVVPQTNERAVGSVIFLHGSGMHCFIPFFIKSNIAKKKLRLRYPQLNRKQVGSYGQCNLRRTPGFIFCFLILQKNKNKKKRYGYKQHTYAISFQYVLNCLNFLFMINPMFYVLNKQQLNYCTHQMK